MRRLARRAAAFLLAAAAATPLSGCVGLGMTTGAVIDTTMNAVAYPVHEFVCLGAYKYDNDADLPWRPFPEEARSDYGEELIGVAVSGGGSRAAYFLACVLDEMRRIPAPGTRTAVPGALGGPRSLLDEVDVLSSVSGGSLSSAYYVVKRPRTREPKALDAFFARYREDMRLHFEARSLGRMLLGFRWIPLLVTYFHRGHLLSGVWDANFFDDATFADLPPPGGSVPSLVINAASYSTANKFLFTRIPIARFNGSRLFRGLSKASFIRGGHAPEHTPFLASSFETIDSDLGGFKLSYAVAASASVPWLLGPTVVKDRSGDDRYETLGDGGLYDNYGLETLVQLFASILEERPGLRARIIIVDGSGYFPAEFSRGRLTVGQYMDRTNSIAWLRSGGFAETVYRLVPYADPTGEGRVRRDGERLFDRERSPYRNLTANVVSLYYEGAAKEAPDTFRPRDVITGKLLTRAVSVLNEQVRGIGPRFKISDDDAALVEVQARLAVRAALMPGAGAKADGGPAPPATNK